MILNNVLITGGSSGIGLELAKLFLQNGYQCCLVALDDDRLKAVEEDLINLYPQSRILAYGIDLSTDDSADAVYAYTQDQKFYPDVVINNAGFGTYGLTWETDRDTEYKMINLHVKTLYGLTRHYLQDMVKDDHGIIVNISSISAFQPSPYLNTYASTKAFVYHFTRGLQAELHEKRSNVKAITICPTPVRTNFGEGTSIDRSGLFQSWLAVDVDMVANSIYDAIIRGKSFRVPGRFYHLLSYVTRLLPEWIQVRIAISTMRPKH